MAVFKAPKNEGKASSLEKPETLKIKKEPRVKKKREGKKGNAPSVSKPHLSLIADIVLIIFLVGVIVGAYFGIRALKHVFAPVEELRDITFCIALRDVPQESVPTNQNGTFAMLDNPVWFTDDAGGDKLGVVTDVDFELVEQGNADLVTLYLTVSATATYRDGTYAGGAGYYMGSTRIVGGLEGIFRMNGFISEGEIISVTFGEAQGDSSPETEEATVADDETTVAEDTTEEVTEEATEDATEDTTEAPTDGESQSETEEVTSADENA